MANTINVKMDDNKVTYLSGGAAVDLARVLDSLKKARAVDIAANVLLIAGAVYFIAFFNQGIKFNWLIIGIVGLAIGAALKALARLKLAVRLDYDLSEPAERAHSSRVEAWNRFLSSQTVWEISGSAAIGDQRSNSGADVGFIRAEVKRPGKLPFYISSSKPSCIVKTKSGFIVILPNGILTRKGGKFALAEYDGMQIKAYKERFVESGAVPSDAEVVGQTYKHVNNDGSLDGRFADNPAYSVCLYGYVEIVGSEIKLSCSHSEGVDGFASN